MVVGLADGAILLVSMQKESVLEMILPSSRLTQKKMRIMEMRKILCSGAIIAFFSARQTFSKIFRGLLGAKKIQVLVVLNESGQHSSEDDSAWKRITYQAKQTARGSTF